MVSLAQLVYIPQPLNSVFQHGTNPIVKCVSPSTNYLSLVIAAFEVDEEEIESFGDGVELDFFRFCRLITLGSSVIAGSLKVSTSDCFRMIAPKSV